MHREIKAFPVWGHKGYGYKQDGMDLRDWFAANAISAMLTGAGWSDGNWHLEAKAAYEIADAMMEAREL